MEDVGVGGVMVSEEGSSLMVDLGVRARPLSLSPMWGTVGWWAPPAPVAAGFVVVVADAPP